MISILAIFFIGKYFYELAQDYYKHRWLYAILGIVSYYLGTLMGGIIIGVLSELFVWNIDFENNLMLLLIAIPFGLLFTIILYFLLKRKWKNSIIEVKDEIQDIGADFENEDD